MINKSVIVATEPEKEHSTRRPSVTVYERYWDRNVQLRATRLSLIARSPVPDGDKVPSLQDRALH